MELWILTMRTIFIYFFVFLMMRLMGKREIGKLSIFDLVISIMIAEIAVFVLEDFRRPLLPGILPMVVLVAVQIGIAYVMLKSRWLRLLFEGPPSILIEHGKIDRQEMQRQRYNLDDLLLQLRENRVYNVADVEFAILETSGKLTVIPKEERNRPEQQGEVSLTPTPVLYRYEGLPLPLIMDGKVQDNHLAKIGKTRFWLKNQIQEKGASDFKQVFFCSIDHKGRIYVDKKK
ncbi:DUF421 domain-containing protein [Paenibacillus gansuensis]|uniref:DUF421 domain-containing protein n=1 Tax=Paenibacillus gansuensis TaxID=306542 RepID=A0ABW5PBK7_9BACL